MRLFGSGGDYEGVGGNSIVVADAIYEECSFLRRGFCTVKFDHCPREASNVAHILACNSEGSLPILREQDPLDFILALLADDVTII
jgi:hypothetical protein